MLWLDSSAPDFPAAFAVYVDRPRGGTSAIEATVSDIVAAIRKRGDAALVDYTARFDGWAPSHSDRLRVDPAHIAPVAAQVAPEIKDALALAASRIHDFHQRQRPSDYSYRDDLGAELGWRWTAIDAAGLYIPGGTASYPSSLLMNAIPAKIAGVKRIVITVPSSNGQLNPLIAAAADLLKLEEIYLIGGAQAIAALAYGTKAIRPVDKITGPGNAYVAEAKRQVFGKVGIDSIAGPSEIVVLADSTCNPEWVAADLLSQAEHDVLAQAILITNHIETAAKIEAALLLQLATLPRAAIARASWENSGAIIKVQSLADAPDLINALAPEHLALAVERPDELLPAILHAGSIFLGHLTTEPFGDYLAGPNHVLPTARAACYASGLSVGDFMKRTSLCRFSAKALAELGPATMTLAEAEGLSGHARAVKMRLDTLTTTGSV